MIDTPQPKSYKTFVEWLTAFCAYHGTQRAAAKAAGVTPQGMTKWLAGKNITIKRLNALAKAAKVDATDLLILHTNQLLDADVRLTSALMVKGLEHDPELMTATPMGAITGRKWEGLYEPARSQILGLIETFLALQSPSHRKYGLEQQELARQREKPPSRRRDPTTSDKK